MIQVRVHFWNCQPYWICSWNFHMKQRACSRSGSISSRVWAQQALAAAAAGGGGKVDAPFISSGCGSSRMCCRSSSHLCLSCCYPLLHLLSIHLLPNRWLEETLSQPLNVPQYRRQYAWDWMQLYCCRMLWIGQKEKDVFSSVGFNTICTVLFTVDIVRKQQKARFRFRSLMSKPEATVMEKLPEMFWRRKLEQVPGKTLIFWGEAEFCFVSHGFCSFLDYWLLNRHKYGIMLLTSVILHDVRYMTKSIWIPVYWTSQTKTKFINIFSLPLFCCNNLHSAEKSLAIGKEVLGNLDEVVGFIFNPDLWNIPVYISNLSI